MDREKCDMGVFIFVTTQITEEKADEVAMPCVDTETGTANSFLPGILEITDRGVMECLSEDFTGGFEIGHLEFCELEAHAAEVCAHCTESLAAPDVQFLATPLLHAKRLSFSHTKLSQRYTGYFFCIIVRCTGAGCIWDNQVGNSQSYLKDLPGGTHI